MANRRNRIPGVPVDAERTINASAEDFDARLRRLERRAGRAGVVIADTAAKPGEFLNVEAPPTGLTIILPEPVPSLLDARVTLNFRNTNPVRIVSIRGQVNRESFVVSTAIGTFEAICDGLDGWGVETGVTSSGSAVDAEYVLGAAHGSLPNGRVLSDGFRTTADLATPGQAQVDWTGLQTQLDGADLGLAHTVNVAGGRLSLASNVATLNLVPDETVVTGMTGTQNAYALPSTLKNGDVLNWSPIAGAITLNGIVSAGVPAGFEFTLTQSNGGFPDGNQVTINDESGSAVAANRFALPDNVTIMMGTGNAVRIRRTSSRWQILERAFPRASTSNVFGGASGRELQRAAISGDITIAQNSNTAAITAGVIVNADVNAAAAIALTKTGAMTGFAEKASGSAASTSAEPIVTYSASANMSAERVTTSSTSVTVSTSVANQIQFQRAALTGAITAAANSNATLFDASASGAGLTGGGTAVLAVGAGSRITVNADDVAWTGFDVDENTSGFPGVGFKGIDFIDSASTQWVTSAPGGGLIGASIALTGTTTEVTIASATSNLGTINIAALECGGSVRVTSSSSAFSIEGFTAKSNGFWFYFESSEGLTNTCTLFNEDVTATAANRMSLPLERDITTGSYVRGIFYYRDSRWNWVGGSPNMIGRGLDSRVEVQGSTEIVSTSGAVNITAGTDVTITAPSTVTANGNVVVLIHDAGDEVVIQADDNSGGFLALQEAASSTTTVDAGRGMLWVRNDAPTTPMFTDDTNVDAELVLGSGRALVLTGSESLSTTGTVNDHALAASTRHLRWGGGAGDLTLTGMSGGVDGRIVFIRNSDGTLGDDLTIAHEGAGSTATNRFVCANQANVVIRSRGMVVAVYDGTSSRWYISAV